MKPQLGTVEFFVPSFDAGVTFLAKVILIEKYEEIVIMRLQWPHMGTDFDYTVGDGKCTVAVQSVAIEVRRDEEGNITIPGTAILAFDCFFLDSEKKELVGCETQVRLMSLE